MSTRSYLYRFSKSYQANRAFERLVQRRCKLHLVSRHICEISCVAITRLALAEAKITPSTLSFPYIRQKFSLIPAVFLQPADCYQALICGDVAEKFCLALLYKAFPGRLPNSSFTREQFSKSAPNALKRLALAVYCFQAQTIAGHKLMQFVCGSMLEITIQCKPHPQLPFTLKCHDLITDN